MKKIIALLAGLTFSPMFAHADATPVASPTPAPAVIYPTTAQNTFLGGQVVAEIMNHGAFYEEYRRGQKQIIVSDDIIEAGHIASQYLFGLSGNVYQNPVTTGPDFEAKLKLNLNAVVNKYVTLTPQYEAILGNLQYSVAAGYDFGQNQSHGWIATFDLGLGFGPGAGVAAPQ